MKSRCLVHIISLMAQRMHCSYQLKFSASVPWLKDWDICKQDSRFNKQQGHLCKKICPLNHTADVRLLTAHCKLSSGQHTCTKIKKAKSREPQLKLKWNLSILVNITSVTECWQPSCRCLQRYRKPLNGPCCFYVLLSWILMRALYWTALSMPLCKCSLLSEAKKDQEHSKMSKGSCKKSTLHM